MTLEEVLAKSEDKLKGLLPVVAEASRVLIKRCYNRGINIRITQGLRTIEEQNALYAQGRTTSGSIVTNAKGGYSFHNFGVSIDFVLMASGYDMKADNNNNGIPDWQEVVEEAKALGFAWGGDWKSFKDNPHFEMTFGLTTAQYRAGKRPTEAQIQAAYKVIDARKEDNKVMSDKTYNELLSRIKELESKVEALSNRESMKVPEWAEKSIESAIKKGLFTEKDGGSYTFYRIITILQRKGIL